MIDKFSWNLTPSSLFYVGLFVATFLLHFLSVSYVVGGVLYLGWRQALARESSSLGVGISRIVRDWMPFMLSVAITLGVAPLLFIQIVYPKHFYTANLLLAWRWMLVIPALICGFYLLYVIKTSYFERASRGLRMAVLAFTCACFLFVGASWSADHILQQLDMYWPHMYFDTNALGVLMPFAAVRTTVWLGAMLLSFPMLIAWQNLWIPAAVDDDPNRMMKGLKWIVRSGLLLGAAGLLAMREPMIMSDWEHLRSPLFQWMLGLIAGFGLVYWLCWERMKTLPDSALKLLLPTFFLLLGGIAGAVAREINRMGSIGLSHHQKWMEEAAGIGGMWLFILFVLINAILIGYCIRLVSRRIQNPVER